MTERKIFGLVVRVIGLWFILLSFQWIFSALVLVFKRSPETQDWIPGQNPIQAQSSAWPIESYWMSGGWRLVVGLLLFFLANQIVRLAYRKSADSAD